VIGEDLERLTMFSGSIICGVVGGIRAGQRDLPRPVRTGGVLPHLKEGARASFRRATLVQAGGAGVEPVGCAAAAGAGATGTI
jgi:hypothetical protein